jgi:hypothetical protein
MSDSLLEVIPWNGSGVKLTEEVAKAAGIPKDYFTSKGEIIYGNKNTFAIDIRFKADRPGFVVQHIQKRIYDKDKKKIIEDIQYWEIFYISPKTKYQDPTDGSFYYLSENADSFKYGTNARGNVLHNREYVQIGVSEFYPYDNSDGAVIFNDKGIMLYSPRLEEFFGSSVVFGNTRTPANGLPYSPTKIHVNGLSMSGPALQRVVSGEWNDHTGKQVELKEEFQYLDPPDGIRKDTWSLPRFDYLKDLKDEERIKIADKVSSVIDISEIIKIEKEDTELDIANNLFDYLTALGFSNTKKKGGKNSKKKRGGTRKYKNKSKKTKSRKKKMV